MNENMIAYRKSGAYYTPLKLTGKWMLERSPGRYEYTMHLEYKGWVFKRWISEHDVAIRPEPNIITMECGK